MALRKFGRRSDHRRAMLRNLAASIILAEKVRTGSQGQTTAQHYGKNDYSGQAEHSSCTAPGTGYLLDETAVKKLFDEIAPRYVGREEVTPVS